MLMPSLRSRSAFTLWGRPALQCRHWQSRSVGVGWSYINICTLLIVAYLLWTQLKKCNQHEGLILLFSEWIGQIRPWKCTIAISSLWGIGSDINILCLNKVRKVIFCWFVSFERSLYSLISGLKWACLSLKIPVCTPGHQSGLATFEWKTDGVFVLCQLNLIKPHPHSLDELELNTIKWVLI